MTRCLLVDDDPDIRTLVLAYLQRFGFAAEAVGDGAGLRSRLPRGGIDVLLLDLMLPDEDGLTLCQWVNAIYLWHCDRDGLNSLYSAGATDQNYLRAR